MAVTHAGAECVGLASVAVKPEETVFAYVVPPPLLADAVDADAVEAAALVATVHGYFAAPVAEDH